jgi:putative salt-induced outer membrane protein YdiY
MNRVLYLPMMLVCLAAVSALGFAATDGQQDEVLLKDGSLVKGVVTDVRDGVVTLETGFAGSISIQLDQIETLNSNVPATLLLSDDSVLQEQPLMIENSQLVTTTGEQYDLSELQIVNPAPWELGQGYNWSGLVNFAIEMERGNTDTDELDYKIDTEWLSTHDRWGYLLQGETDEANGIKTADNWRTEVKYDYFLSDLTYVGMAARAREDRFADIDLRYMVGPHVGHKFFTDPIFTLNAEAGAAYTNDDFVLGDDDDYVSGTWLWDITSDYLGGDSRLYINQVGFLNLEETSEVSFDTTIGLAFPLLWGLEVAAEILLEYEKEVADGVDELDETYKLRIGYGW